MLPEVVDNIICKGAQFILTSFEHNLSGNPNSLSGSPNSYQFSGRIDGCPRTLTHEQIREAFALLLDILAVNTPYREGNRLYMHKFVVTSLTFDGMDANMFTQSVYGEVVLQRLYFLDLIKSSRKLFAKSEGLP